MENLLFIKTGMQVVRLIICDTFRHCYRGIAFLVSTRHHLLIIHTMLSNDCFVCHYIKTSIFQCPIFQCMKHEPFLPSFAWMLDFFMLGDTYILTFPPLPPPSEFSDVRTYGEFCVIKTVAIINQLYCYIFSIC